MAERAKLRKQEVQAIQAQIERSEEFSKFTVNSIVKVPRDYWGKKYAENLPPHIRSHLTSYMERLLYGTSMRHKYFSS